MKDDIDVYHEAVSNKELEDAGIEITELDVKDQAFGTWAHTRKELTTYTRLIRYYLSSQIMQLHGQDSVLDVGSGDDIYNSVISDMVDQCILNDVSFQNSVACDFYCGNIVDSRF